MSIERRGRWRVFPVAGVLLAASLVAGACAPGSDVLHEQIEARKAVSSLRTAFAQQASASTRARVASYEAEGRAAAGDASAAAVRVAEDRNRVSHLIAVLDYRAEARLLAQFDASYRAYAQLEGDLLSQQEQGADIEQLARTLGRMRVVAAACEEALSQLERSLAGHGSEASR